MRASNCWITDLLNGTVRAVLAFMVGMITTEPAYAGNGSFNKETGEFNFCVSVRFDPEQYGDPEEIVSRIRERFQAASQILADATDGQHRFGTVTIVTNSAASQIAEFFIHPGHGGADAPIGKYGVRGEHVNLYFEDYFMAEDEAGVQLNAFSIAHEFAHQAYGLMDEYEGPGHKPARCASISEKGPALNYSLMDDFKSRGGAAIGLAPTLKEFCVGGVSHNHNLDDTHPYQQEPCWQTIERRMREKYGSSIVVPDALPNKVSPPNHDINAPPGSAGLEVMFVIDESESMRFGMPNSECEPENGYFPCERRLSFAIDGVLQFLDLVSSPGVAVGLTSFNKCPCLKSGLAESRDNVVRGLADIAEHRCPDGLPFLENDQCNGTNISKGLREAFNQLEKKPSCEKLLILLTDGEHNVKEDNPLDVVSALQQAHIAVLALGVGQELPPSAQALLQTIADQTGGRFFRINEVGDARDFVGPFFSAASEATNSALVVHDSGEDQLGAGTKRDIPIPKKGTLEADTEALTVAVAAEKQAALAVRLLTPSNDDVSDQYRLPTSESIPDMAPVPGERILFRVPSPAPGQWRVELTSLSSTKYQVFASAEHNGVQLNAALEDTIVKNKAPLIVRATPLFMGRRVMHATIEGDVIHPDGKCVGVHTHSRRCTLDHDCAIGGICHRFKDHLVLRDDEQDTDAVADDGIYSASFDKYTQDGTYTFELAVASFGSEMYPGEAIEQTGLAAVTVPDFTRMAIVTAVAGCGSGIKDESEECDDGNLVDGDGCDSNCTKTRCGNGVQTAGEECDDGGKCNDGAACTADFQCPGGDCKPQDGDGCQHDCTTFCGDGIRAGAEQCDDGGKCIGGSNAGATCTAPLQCPDGVCQPQDDDACKNDCTFNICGDGILFTGHEECDDGNPIDGDGCDHDCTLTRCGNGVQTAGEECDDENTDEHDACKNDCTLNICGDGVVRAGYEDCDDGNRINGDGCDNNCTRTRCGNGIQTAGEECDDGNDVNTDDCKNDCTENVCGDGVINVGKEDCDDGNHIAGDGCSNCGSCTIAPIPRSSASSFLILAMPVAVLVAHRVRRRVQCCLKQSSARELKRTPSRLHTLASQRDVEDGGVQV